MPQFDLVAVGAGNAGMSEPQHDRVTAAEKPQTVYTGLWLFCKLCSRTEIRACCPSCRWF